MFNDLLHIILPELCYACSNELIRGEKLLCIKCQATLPVTNSHLDQEHAVSRKFIGRSQLQFAAAFTYYNTGGIMQEIIHRIKYKGARNLAYHLGALYGLKLREVHLLDDLSIIVPVPLHPRKLKSRGYNQAELIARGISASLDVPCNPSLILKKSDTGSQTRKDLFDRWENTNEVFQINRKFQALEQSHILLVDDVITTGSTLCACADLFQRELHVKVSVAALSFTLK